MQKWEVVQSLAQEFISAAGKGGMAYNVKRLAAVPGFYSCLPELKPNRKPKYKINSDAHLRSVTLELLLISEQKVDAAYRLPA